MLCKLNLRLTTPIPDHLGEKYSELQKSFDLPFAPFIGLRLHFTPVDRDDPNNNPAYVDELRRTKSRLTGFITVEEVTYFIDTQCFSLKAYRLCRTVEDLESVRRQAVLGFGFEHDPSELQADDEV